MPGKSDITNYISDKIENRIGGIQLVKIIVILASVLALSSADRGALSVTAVQIEHYFHISKASFGILGSVSTGVGAVATLPFGFFVDKANRVRLLFWSVSIWSVAMILSGIAFSYQFLLGSRILLGILTAAAYPAIASLIGDYFKNMNRGSAYGWILSGELIGTAIGILISDVALAVVDSWRSVEFALVIPALIVAWSLSKIQEPKRSSRKAVQKPAKGGWNNNTLEENIEKKGITPNNKLILRDDPLKLSVWSSIIFILKIPTNQILIAASTLAYFFLTGLEFFAIQFIEDHYHLGHASASGIVLLIGAGALIGLILSGRYSDHLVKIGEINGRIMIPAIGIAASVVLFAAGISLGSITFAIIFLFLAALFFAASLSPLDAARLDIMVPRLWGRSESTRSTVRGVFEALAPVSFGLVSTNVFSGAGSKSLEYTFLIMLIPIFLSSAIITLALKTYAKDTATAISSQHS